MMDDYFDFIQDDDEEKNLFNINDSPLFNLEIDFFEKKNIT